MMLPNVFVPCKLTFLSKLSNIINSSVVLKNEPLIKRIIEFTHSLVAGLSGTQNELFQTNQIFQGSAKFKV